jgi:hypothetical protein
MAYGCFVDRADRPDLERAEQALGAARPLWDALLAELRRHTHAAPAWRFYGRNYGWALAVKKSGRALAALFPDDDRLTVLVVLTAAQADAALSDPAVSQATRTLISSLPRFNEGCWAFVPVADDGGQADACELIAIRARHGPECRAASAPP